MFCSIAAGKFLYEKFVNLFFPDSTDQEGLFPTPKQVLKIDKSILKTSLPPKKVNIILSIAELFHSETITHEKLLQMTEEQITETLSKIKGIGRWTIQIFMMLTLKKLNILPVDDIALRKGMSLHFLGKKLTNKKLLKPSQMAEMAQVWEPYRSLGSYIMWKVAGGLS